MEPNPDSHGHLFVVATPIGNLGDITRRAVETLARVDLIAAEDTRHSRRLLQHLGISTPLLSLHEHNETQRSKELVTRMRAGEEVALISDAGTPMVSDPGYRLVNAAIEAGLVVEAVPGASAVLAAIMVSGLPTDRFQFEGFLPATATARRKRLATLAALPHTLICFESPRRLQGSLQAVAAVMGESRRCVVARELTKMHETVLRGCVADLLRAVAEQPDMQRGEAVLLIGPAEDTDSGSVTLRPAELIAVLSEELPPGRAAAVAAKLTGRPRREFYPAGKTRPDVE